MSALSPAERLGYIGASESAALLGCSPYTSAYELWQVKSGRVPPRDLNGIDRIDAGRFLEPGIAEWAKAKWGMDLAKVSVYRTHPAVAKMGASWDYEDHDGNVPVEIKNVDGLEFRKKWAVDGDVIVDAPTHILVQLMHQMACCDWKPTHGWIIACVGGNSLFRMRVERHDALIRYIETKVTEFWQSVADGREPAPDFDKDGAILGQVFARGSGETVDLSSSNRMAAVCDGYLAAKEREKAAGKEADAYLSEIKATVGTASRALVNGFSISVADIKEAEVPAYTRKGYRKFTVKREEG